MQTPDIENHSPSPSNGSLYFSWQTLHDHQPAFKSLQQLLSRHLLPRRPQDLQPSLLQSADLQDDSSTICSRTYVFLLLLLLLRCFRFIDVFTLLL